MKMLLFGGGAGGYQKEVLQKKNSPSPVSSYRGGGKVSLTTFRLKRKISGGKGKGKKEEEKDGGLGPERGGGGEGESGLSLRYLGERGEQPSSLGRGKKGEF